MTSAVNAPFAVLLLRNKKSLAGLILLGLFILAAVFADFLAPYDPKAPIFEAYQPPSVDHLFGTTKLGQDIFSQLVFGCRSTLIIALTTATISTLLAVLIGGLGGYIGGWVDQSLNTLVNAFLVIPGLPLMIVIAGYASNPGLWTVILVLALTTWAHGARVIRSQTLSLRERDFIHAARTIGETWPRMLFYELAPNLISIIFALFLTGVLVAILASATLEFLGLADQTVVTWGTMLYWAGQGSAMSLGLWWWFIPPGLAIASLVSAFSLINFGVDQVSDRRLKAEKGGR